MEVTLISIKDRLRGYGRINQTFCSNGGTVCSSASWTVDSNQWLAGLKVHFESRDCQCSEVAHAPSFTNHGRCWVAIGRRISFGRSPVRVLGLPLLPARTKLTAIRAFANSRLSSRARRAPREPFPLAGSIPNMPPMRASDRGTDNRTRSQRAAPIRAKMRLPIPPRPMEV